MQFIQVLCVSKKMVAILDGEKQSQLEKFFFNQILVMTTRKFCVSACRYCRYYTPVGQRGGTCQIFNVSVKSGWKACSLSIRSFPPSLEEISSTDRFN